MSTDWKSYARFFQDSWKELEKEFRRGNLNPQHENDVVCYLYHALAKRLKKKGWPLYYIRTEDTHNIRKQTLRPDLNLNERLFIEVKMYPLRKYRDGWTRRKNSIRYNVRRLEEYVKHTKATTPFRVRKPVLALWFRKRDREMKMPLEDTLIPSDLEKMLDDEAERYKDRITIVYGPKSQ
jgi:hypothetical protein